MIILDCEQGSAEWYQARLGIATSSEFSSIITPARGDYSKQATGYMNKLIAEKLTGKEATGFMSDWMERGKEMEDEARLYYEFEQDVTVKQVGFVYQDEKRLFGCSPDGLIVKRIRGSALGQSERGLEIKCPSPGVMVGYLLRGDVPTDYIPQLQGSMFITGYKQWDFIAYHPDFDPMFVTVYRDEGYIERLADHLDRFTKELSEKLGRLIGDPKEQVDA